MREIIIVLDNIRSALNVGAILRTADGLGVNEVIICGISPTPDHPKVFKTSLGAENYVKWTYEKDILAQLKHLKKQNYQIISVEQTKESKNLYQTKFGEKVALVFGHEITGVSIDAINISDLCVEIPMLGKKNSFNVATTVGIVTSFVRSSEINEKTN